MSKCRKCEGEDFNIFEKPLPSSIELISEECDRMKDVLAEKNKRYGDSAFNNGILFPVPPLTAIKARINDKVSRIKESVEGDEEDAVEDLCGYLILYMIAKRKEENG